MHPGQNCNNMALTRTQKQGLGRMGLAIPYMGTKKNLAPAVADIICAAKPGVVLDAFSGMCAIGNAVGDRRPVWNNDVQYFAATVASALFTSRRPLKPRVPLLAFLRAAFTENQVSLCERFSRRLRAERQALEKGTVKGIRAYLAESRHVGSSRVLERERVTLADSPHTTPYRLCSITYADGFFGLRQAIDLDSARCALEAAYADGIADEDERRWLLVALCYVAVRVATTTGHFAQFLKVNGNNVLAYLNQRRRCVWTAWTDVIGESGMRMLGSGRWRRQNRVFNSESLSLLGMLSVAARRPAVVYADPPYTDDQYSRYYHVWETLVRYDYPSVEGEGRYRPDRFFTPFSRREDVAWAFQQLIKRSADLGADLVISYPDRGLLQLAGYDLSEMLARDFSNVAIALEVPHSHSTMGASKGVAKSNVTERVYLASNN
jgi:adenine-specific DNA-methyltransferase